MPHKKGHCLTDDGNIIEDCMDAMNASEYAKYNPMAEPYRKSRNPVEEHVHDTSYEEDDSGRSVETNYSKQDSGDFGLDYTGEGEHGNEKSKNKRLGWGW